MIANQLMKLIKARRGPVIVEISNFHDTFYVQAVKADLLLQFARFKDNEETGFEIDASGFLSKDQDAAWR